MTTSTPPPDALAARPSAVDRCVSWIRTRILSGELPPGARAPSVRALAKGLGVSPFTAVQAYDRLTAEGLLIARRGSGFYVRGAAPDPGPPLRDARAQVDLTWLMRNMLDLGSARGPGLGVLPAAWLDGAQVATALRAVGRQGPSRWLESGSSRGFQPLREVLSHRLRDLDIAAPPDQIVLTSGITQALSLTLQRLVAPGDAVMVLEPSWFGALGMLEMHGAFVIAAPMTPQGPDLAALEQLASRHSPRLLVINAAAHNPTGLSLSAEAVAAIHDIARRHDFWVFEDDVYADLCMRPSPRLAAGAGLERVIYAGGFSKTLAANIRVGFLATGPDLAREFADRKVLTGFTTPELNERVVHHLLVEGRWRAHLQTLRERLSQRRAEALAELQGAGFEIFAGDGEGLFLWVKVGGDTDALAAAARAQGRLLAPGSLFSPARAPSPWMRWNVTADFDAGLRDLLAPPGA